MSPSVHSLRKRNPLAPNCMSRSVLLWLIGLLTSHTRHTTGGFVHVMLALAVVLGLVCGKNPLSAVWRVVTAIRDSVAWSA
jgi:hypothetical protein